jgi:hypothetical protein
LYGEMQATAPAGWRFTYAPMSAPGASGVDATGDGGRAIPRFLPASRAYRSKRSIATGTCIREPTVAVAPVSAMISGTRSACSFMSSSVTARSSAARSATGVEAHAGNASCAARAASSAWSTDASGASPTTASVAGFTIGAVPFAPSTRSPPISSFHSWSDQSAMTSLSTLTSGRCSGGQGYSSEPSRFVVESKRLRAGYPGTQ